MKKILLLALGMFSLGVDAYVISGLLPGIAATFQSSEAKAGQTVTVFTLCYALAAPVFATLLSGKSVWKLMVLALGIFSAANAVSALAPSLYWLLAARAVAGLGAGLFSPLAVATASSLVGEKRRGQALGLTLGGMSSGTVVGVPLGLAIASHFGWQSTLWLVTLLGLVGLVGILWRLPEIPAAAPPSLYQRMAMLSDTRVAATVGITFLTAVASLGLYTYVSPVLQSAGIQQVAPYLWAWGIGGMIGSFTVGRMIDWTGRPAHLMAGILAFLAIALSVLPNALHWPCLALLSFTVWGAMGWASATPQQHRLLSLRGEHGAVAVALNSSATYLGGAVGSGLLGLVMQLGLAPAHLPLLTGSVALLGLFAQMYILTQTKTSACTADPVKTSLK